MTLTEILAMADQAEIDDDPMLMLKALIYALVAQTEALQHSG